MVRGAAGRPYHQPGGGLEPVLGRAATRAGFNNQPFGETQQSAAQDREISWTTFSGEREIIEYTITAGVDRRRSSVGRAS